jgi:hypothetical protein
VEIPKQLSKPVDSGRKGKHPMKGQLNSQSNDCGFVLTDAQSMCSITNVRYGDIEKRLRQSHKDAYGRLVAIREEQSNLYPAYRRYVDLEKQAAFYENRAKRIAAALREKVDVDATDESVKQKKNLGNAVLLAMNPNDVPIWEIISAILEETGELQVVELELALRNLGIKTSRSAIESAFKTHQNEFRIRMSGRNKFVSMKGA